MKKNSLKNTVMIPVWLDPIWSIMNEHPKWSIKQCNIYSEGFNEGWDTGNQLCREELRKTHRIFSYFFPKFFNHKK